LPSTRDRISFPAQRTNAPLSGKVRNAIHRLSFKSSTTNKRMNRITPLSFERIAIPKPWAGDALTQRFPQLAQELPAGTGESVELACIGGESRLDSIIITEHSREKPFSTWLGQCERESVLGKGFESEERFPLMLKLLDTAEPLSVQVHQQDSWQEGKLITRGKWESWVVIDAEPDAYVLQGLKADVSEAEFWRALDDGDPAAVLEKRFLTRGDFLDSPPGMVHAIGGGLSLVELQQASNITFRMHDWPKRDGSERGRKLHIEEARKSARLELPPGWIKRALLDPVDPAKPGNRSAVLRDSAPFRWLSHMLYKPAQLTLLEPRARILTCLQGKLMIHARAEAALHAHVLEAPNSLLVPAALTTLELFPEGDEPVWLLEAQPLPTKAPAFSSNNHAH